MKNLHEAPRTTTIEDHSGLASAAEMAEIYSIPVVANLIEELYQYHKKTAIHSLAVGEYALSVLDELNDALNLEQRRAIAIAATLHDVGKLDISPSLIDHPGAFNDKQRAEMSAHTSNGEKRVRDKLNGKFDPQVSELIAFIVANHHNKNPQDVEDCIESSNLSDDFKEAARIGLAIVRISDIADSVIPTGTENSHNQYDKRDGDHLEIFNKILRSEIRSEFSYIDEALLDSLLNQLWLQYHSAYLAHKIVAGSNS